MLPTGTEEIERIARSIVYAECAQFHRFNRVGILAGFWEWLDIFDFFQRKEEKKGIKYLTKEAEMW
jgi:hypothetical protein